MSAKATIVVGGWFGDEGKGKIVSYLALQDNFAHMARAGVGTNAGHTVVLDGIKYPLRMVPSGFSNRSARLYIGRGVLVNPDVLLSEMREYKLGDRVWVDRLCPIIEQKHIEKDRQGYNRDSVGSTGSGCGPAQLERISRSQEMRFAKDVPELKRFTADVSSRLLEALDKGEPVLVEQTQGTMLSIYGFEIGDKVTYHNATTKDTTAGTACADVGIGPTDVSDVIVVYKAIPSRVGTGVFPGELPDEAQKKLREEGKGEYGTVTGRPRRLGEWTPDVFGLARKTARMNGATQIALTKFDVRYVGNTGVKSKERLTSEAREFIDRIEDNLQVMVTLVGTGPDTYDIIDTR